MRRLALLFAGGALWLAFLAVPVFADGGPHSVTINSGTGSVGLAGDCAGCHRAHTADARNLLVSSEPGLCIACHNGTGATTNVESGVQYVPDGTFGQGDPILGALRGGGFTSARIGDPARLSYNSRNGIVVTLAAAGSGTFDLVWPAFGTETTQTLTITAPLTDATAAALQTTVNGFWGTSTTYTGATAAQYMSSTTQNLMTVTVSTTNRTVTFTPHNEFRLVTIPLPSIANNNTGTTATVANNIAIGNVAHIDVLAGGVATTSMHEGLGRVWGNGQQGIDTAGSGQVELECTNCHNPHGNGQYRILSTEPGSAWTGAAAGDPAFVHAANGVEVFDVGTTASTKNYTVKQGIQASDVVGSATAGDYWRYKLDPSGASNWTNFYLTLDPMNTGWNGLSITNPSEYELASTTVGAAGIDGSATTLPIVSAAGFPTTFPFYINVQSEIMQVTKLNAGPTFTVTRGQDGTAKVAHASGAAVTVNQTTTLWNKTGLMTAWCITCHTRYNGYAVNDDGTIDVDGSAAGGSNPSSLVAQTPIDDVFMFKHGTTRLGCEQCHVSHGTNVTMNAASTINYPDGTAGENSALLKVDNRGTCQLCHDPTETVPAGTTVGTVPAAPVPGP